MTRNKDERPRPNEAANAADTAPVDHDTHGNPIKRVPGPGPNDEGKGAAGPDAAPPLKKH
jgi:hypothetical protein